VAIGFTAAAGYSFVPELITAARERLPGVDFILEEMVTAEQLEALTSHRIDVALLRPPVRREFESVRVLREPLLAALPADHRLAKGRLPTLSDFDRQPFVMYSPYEAGYFYDLVAAIFAKAGVAPRYVQHISQVHPCLGKGWTRSSLGPGSRGKSALPGRRASSDRDTARATRRALPGLGTRKRQSGSACLRGSDPAQFSPVCTENLDSDVLMMQPADQGIRHNASKPLNWARGRRILSQGAMSSRRVVIARIGFYESAQVLLTQCDDMVNALASDRPNQPFHEAILPRRARRNRHWRQRAEPRKYVRAANIPGMDDGIAAGECRERLRPQQAMGIGNRVNSSHHARSDYKRSRGAPRAPC
jgi:LysR substrate binding domain